MMGMMGMGWMMVLGIVLAVIVILLVIAVISRAAGGSFNREQLHDDTEKPKCGQLMLTDDGELLEIVDSDWDDDEKRTPQMTSLDTAGKTVRAASSEIETCIQRYVLLRRSRV